MATTSLRQLSVGEILDVAINIAWKKAGILVPVVAIVVVPTQILSILLSLGNGGGAIIGAVISAAAAALATGACFKAVRDTYLGEPASARGSLSFAVHRFRSLFWLSILTSLLPALGLILFVVPGVWLWVVFGVSVPVLMAEGIRGTDALGRSRQLVKGRWWATFGVMFLAFVLTLIAEAAIGSAFVALVLSGTGSTARVVGDGIGTMVAALITTPFTTAALTVLYFDLRVRKEGFDLEQQIERMPMPGVEAFER